MYVCGTVAADLSARDFFRTSSQPRFFSTIFSGKNFLRICMCVVLRRLAYPDGWSAALFLEERRRGDFGDGGGLIVCISPFGGKTSVRFLVVRCDGPEGLLVDTPCTPVYFLLV